MITIGYLKYRAKGNAISDFFFSNAAGCESHYNTIARITFDGRQFAIENLKELPWVSLQANEHGDASSK